MSKRHEVKMLSFENNHMRLEVDGKEYVFNLKEVSPRLLHASAQERNKYEISPGGYGIHWPLVDEDLSIDGLLGIKREPSESQRHLQGKARTSSR